MSAVTIGFLSKLLNAELPELCKLHHEEVEQYHAIACTRVEAIDSETHP